MLGFIGLIGPLMATRSIKFLGRRTLFIIGHAGIAIFHLLIAVFNIEGNNILVLIMLALFMLMHTNTTGIIAWVYATETTIDSGMGICLGFLWGTVLLLSIVCPIILDPETLGPNGTFLIFSGLSVIATVYMCIFIKETMGKTDRAKKQLFMPAQFIERIEFKTTEIIKLLFSFSL